MTPEQARAFLEAAEGDRLEALYRVAIALGLRLGEALGLSWDDVDLDSGTLRVRHALQRINKKLTLKDPKTEKSRRALTMPASLVGALKAHKDRQTFERAAMGDEWRQTGLIFTNTLGSPLEPSNVLKRFKALLAQTSDHRIEVAYRAANGIPTDAVLSVEQTKDLAAIRKNPDHPLTAAHRIPPQRFHDLRHAAASLLIAQGVPVKVVSDILGHSQLATTADIYSHLYPAAHKDAADLMDRILTATW
jgi:integrase